MIRQAKIAQACHAFNGILVQLRSWALMNEDSRKIATVVDTIEQLPRFLGSEEDQTEDFEATLIDLAETFPQFAIGLELFRRETAPSAW